MKHLIEVMKIDTINCFETLIHECYPLIEDELPVLNIPQEPIECKNQKNFDSKKLLEQQKINIKKII